VDGMERSVKKRYDVKEMDYGEVYISGASELYEVGG
jgi:hypothetical protein